MAGATHNDDKAADMTRALPSWPTAALPALVGLAFCASCWVTTRLDGAADTRRGLSVAGALLGGSRVAIAGHFHETADIYFHKGVPHTKETAFSNGLFQRLAKAVSPDEHRHATGQETVQMMPWLWLAVRADPHNVEAVLDTAYWLAREAGDQEEVLRLLNRAQCDNPRDYRIQLAKGRHYIKEGNFAAARGCLDAGLAFWPGSEEPDTDDARKGKAGLLLFRALVHEADGQNDMAAAALEQILVVFPNRSSLRDRIRELRAGTGPSLLPRERGESIFKRHEELQPLPVCTGEHTNCMGE